MHSIVTKCHIIKGLHYPLVSVKCVAVGTWLRGASGKNSKYITWLCHNNSLHLQVPVFETCAHLLRYLFWRLYYNCFPLESRLIQLQIFLCLADSLVPLQLWLFLLATCPLQGLVTSYSCNQRLQRIAHNRCLNWRVSNTNDFLAIFSLYSLSHSLFLFFFWDIWQTIEKVFSSSLLFHSLNTKILTLGQNTDVRWIVKQNTMTLFW